MVEFRLEMDLLKLRNILFINCLFGKVWGSSFVIVYDETYAKDFKMPFPNKNAEASSEWESSSKYELMYVKTLKDLTNVTYNHMNSNKTIFSFISSFHVIEESLQNHYAFSKSLEQLTDQVKAEKSKVCLRYTQSYQQILFLTIYSIAKRKFGIIVDDRFCSKELLVNLQEHIICTSNKTKFFSDIYKLEFVLEGNNSERLQDFFYRLKTLHISLIIVLIPEEYLNDLFHAAASFGLLGSSVIWFLPEYENHRYFTGNCIPKKILIFKEIKEVGDQYYTNIRLLINDLANEYDEAKTLVASHENSDRKVIMLQRLYWFLARRKLLEKVDAILSYRDLSESEEWRNVHARVTRDEFLLNGEAVFVLRSITGFENRKVIKAVTVLDGSYVKNNDGIYDTVTDRCLEGIKCRFETNSKTTCCVGFSIDLFQKIAFDLQFDVDMFIVSDGNYGAFKNGSWNGLIGEILKGKADMAVSALTVMNERLQYVAFTAAYMEDYLGILVKPQEEKLSPINWKFIEPLAGELQLTLWFVIITMMVLVYMFENNEFLATTVDGMKHFVKYYGALESMTYVAGVTLQRDIGGKNPSHFGAQFLAIIFAFGMVIFTTTYTAVLAAQSLQKIEVNPLKGSDDHRIRHPTHEFKYGLVENSAYESLFSSGQSEKLKKMNNFMTKNNFNFKNLDQGLLKLTNGELDAMIAESEGLRVLLSKDSSCTLRLVKDKLFPFGIAYAVRKDVPWKILFDQEILTMKEEGAISELQKKWFTEICEPQFFVDEKNPLTITRLSGLILVLYMTAVGSLLLLFPEHWYFVHMKGRIFKIFLAYFKREEKTYDIGKLTSDKEETDV